MYCIVERIIDYGFKPPELIDDTIYFHDFYLNVYEYVILQNLTVLSTILKHRIGLISNLNQRKV